MFLNECLSEALENGQDIWKELRNFGLLPTPKSDLHGFSLDDLNTFFAGVSYSPTESLQEITSLIEAAFTEGFKFRGVSLNYVILAVKHFSLQTTGTDNIPHKVIAKSLPSIGPYLVILFNQSLAAGYFPFSWKTSLLVAIKKVSTLSQASDLRPVALLCFLSKVLERLAHDQITTYLKEKRLLDPLQTGFRQYSSSKTAFLKLTDDIRVGMSKKLVTLLLQFDFSIAFDTISPLKLLPKLMEMGFSKQALLWIKSYLEGRQLQVTSKTSRSVPLNINLGVPEGSVLRPLLFCIHINNVKSSLDSRISYILYADDLQIYLQTSPELMPEALELLSSTARRVSAWADNLSLRLNPGKTKAIYFGSSTFVDRSNKCNYRGVNMAKGVVVPFLNEVKSLGVILDSKLTWEPHIISIEKKVNKVLYTFRFIRHCTTETLRKQIVQALLAPHLDYCSTVYIDACTRLKVRIQRLSNSGLRYIFGVRKNAHLSPFKKKIGWMRTETRRQYLMGIILYKILRLKHPDYLSHFFTS